MLSKVVYLTPSFRADGNETETQRIQEKIHQIERSEKRTAAIIGIAVMAISAAGVVVIASSISSSILTALSRL